MNTSSIINDSFYIHNKKQENKGKRGDDSECQKISQVKKQNYSLHHTGKTNFEDFAQKFGDQLGQNMTECKD